MPYRRRVPHRQRQSPLRRQNRHRQLRLLQPAPTASAGYEMFLQYQNFEFGIGDIAESILEKCSAEHMDSADLKIYVKPEDKKAYYVCAGGNSFIDL